MYRSLTHDKGLLTETGFITHEATRAVYIKPLVQSCDVIENVPVNAPWMLFHSILQKQTKDKQTNKKPRSLKPPRQYREMPNKEERPPAKPGKGYPQGQDSLLMPNTEIGS